MHPLAKTDRVTVEPIDNGFLLHDGDVPESYLLHPISYHVWTKSDGKTPVSEIAVDLRERLHFDITDDRVWSALDCLADANLLDRRAAPPAAVIRHDGILLVVNANHHTGAMLVAASMNSARFVRFTRDSQQDCSAVEQEERAKEQEGAEKRDRAFREAEEKKVKEWEQRQHENKKDQENRKSGS